MLRRTISSTILTAILLLLIVLPVAAHGDEETVAATFSDGMILTVSLIAAVVAGVGLRAIKLRAIQLAIAALVVMTAIVHLMAGVDAPLLLANGLGYVAILAALYLLPIKLFKDLRVPLYWLLIAYTVITIISFFVIHPWGIEDGSLSFFGLVTKAAEVLLIALLLVDWRQQSQALPGAATEQASQPA
ncbi:MAG: hypothetical protein ACPGWR_31855 [Ardenticatenaceae bacterium]